MCFPRDSARVCCSDHLPEVHLEENWDPRNSWFLDQATQIEGPVRRRCYRSRFPLCQNCCRLPNSGLVVLKVLQDQKKYR
jgi:hypothetical protein